MNILSSQKPSTIVYSKATIKRAERALCCSPFQLILFIQMKATSLPLPMMAGEIGKKQGYTQKSLSEGQAEGALMWLISVGLLRREVDGQGITDSFRLTPLGRQLVEKWEHQGGYFPRLSWWESLLNSLNRWLRLPF